MKAPSYLRLHWPLVVLVLIAGSSVVWPVPGGWLSRLALGWDVGVSLFLAESAVKLARGKSADQIRRHAAALDEAGPAVLPLALVAAIASVAVVVGEAIKAAGGGGGTGGAAALALVTVALSWTFVHVIFAFHYAHAWYAQSAPAGSKAKGKAGDRGGLLFPGGGDPDYWDFLHFSLVIGVAQQTADIQITDRSLRRISTVHSLTAFLFNTVILALTVNMAVSLLGPN